MDEPANSVRLRFAEPEDIETRLTFKVSTEIERMYGSLMEEPAALTREHAEQWFSQLSKHPNAWVIEKNAHLVGEVRLDNLNSVDRRARLAIGLFEEDQLGRGIGRQAIRLVLHQAFGQLALHRVDLRVLAYNVRAIRCYKACGFTCEGIERESALVGGVWYDDWIMGILEQEFSQLPVSNRVSH